MGIDPLTKPIVGFDIDGVLADFTDGFTLLAQNLGLNVRHRACGGQRTWDWNDIPDSDQDRIWDAIDAGHSYWSSLSPLVTPGEIAMMWELTSEFRIVYVTSRKDKLSVKAQTREWLHRHAFPEAPLFLTNDKAAVLSTLYSSRGQIAGFIDDSPRNIRNLSGAGVPVVVRDWQYNREGFEDLPRVSSVAEYCDMMARTRSNAR